MKAAHEGMIIDPSKETIDASNPAKVKASGGICATCHTKTAKTAINSMHSNQNGFRTSLTSFAGKDINEILKDKNHGLSKAFNGNCNNCHATCGQCHVSRPNSQKGGLLTLHKFEKTPPMDKSCYGCHGARNGGEYIGDEGSPGDVHYTKLQKDCTFCHKVNNFHGNGTNEAANMHEMSQLPKCTDCHKDVTSGKSDLSKKMHSAHAKDTLSCYVCHATQNNSCQNCHVSVSKEGKLSSDSKLYQSFKIGLNPKRNALHPEKYVVLRHIPTAADSFKALGDNLLPNYDLVPNWKVSPTHNIQKNTPQNANCTNCHSTEQFFLTKKDLIDTDSKANEKLLVDKIPANK